MFCKKKGVVSVSMYAAEEVRMRVRQVEEVPGRGEGHGRGCGGGSKHHGHRDAG